MTEQAFGDHILYVSGAKSTAHNKTGAKTVIGILQAAKMIEERDGKLYVSSGEDSKVQIATPENSPKQQVEVADEKEPKGAPEARTQDLGNVVTGQSPQVTINIQLQIPGDADADTYENLFAALKRNLFPPKEDG